MADACTPKHASGTKNAMRLAETGKPIFPFHQMIKRAEQENRVGRYCPTAEGSWRRRLLPRPTDDPAASLMRLAPVRHASEKDRSGAHDIRERRASRRRLLRPRRRR